MNTAYAADNKTFVSGDFRQPLSVVPMIMPSQNPDGLSKVDNNPLCKLSLCGFVCDIIGPNDSIGARKNSRSPWGYRREPGRLADIPLECDANDPGDAASSSSSSSDADDLDTCISVLGLSSTIPNVHPLTVEGTFPSLVSTQHLVDAAAKKGSVDLVTGPATAFHRGMLSVYTCLKSSPQDIRDDVRFMISKFLVSLCMDGLEQHIGRPRPNSDRTEECKEYIDKMVYYVKSAVQSLKVFLRDLNEIVAERKAASMAPEGGETVQNIIGDVDVCHISVIDPARRKDVSSVTGLPILPCMENKYIAHRKTSSSQFLRNLLRRFRKSKVILPVTSSSVTLITLPPISDTSAIKDALLPGKLKPLPEIPYECRNSAIYFPTGMDFSNKNMQRLMPTYDDLSIHLTVDEAARFPDFTHTFFVCFGFFTSPQELLDGLVERFHVGKKWRRPGLSSDDSKLMEAQAQAVRVSVVRALTTWLWEYWRPETDKVLLQQIMDFASQEVAEVVPNLFLVWGLAQAVWNIDSKKHYRGIKLESPLEVPIERTLPAPTCFCVWDGSENTPPICKVFETENGREEFVRQITIKASKMFADINPSDAIRYWEAGKRGFDRVRRKIDEFKTFERGL
ncbi:Cell division control protein [Salix suchowensis]|nr:Cell division control protein [Salix suchowensis]